MLKFVIYGDTVKNLNKTFTCKYAVIRRDDMTVIAEMDFFPDCKGDQSSHERDANQSAAGQPGIHWNANHTDATR
ncbi:hypothetical protein EGS58_13510 [Salmonella enterica]|nr:hypothetical protein [Salmonella enterica]